MADSEEVDSNPPALKPSASVSQDRRVVMLGNPNTGKTTLFNRLCGLRHKTSNFPGTTQDARVGTLQQDQGSPLLLIDLPGIYSMRLKQAESVLCLDVLKGRAAPGSHEAVAPDVVCVVTEATNLPRNLLLVGEVLSQKIPTVVVINMVDEARKKGVHADEVKLQELLGCSVVVCSARTGEGVEKVQQALLNATIPVNAPAEGVRALEEWVDEVCEHINICMDKVHEDHLTDRVDTALTHPLFGGLIFLTVMASVFFMIFKLASYPMEWIDVSFSLIAQQVRGVMPPGILSDLLTKGVISGVGATAVFLPQICILFFLISLLEDTGYLARASFLMDRLLRPFGLSGHAFVPLLSSHACALPGIMATRSIPDRRDRLATILSAPFMSCTARIPVYVLLTVLLFPNSAALQALAFAGCYALGIFAGVFSSLIARRTILPGPTRPLAMELPPYRWPSVRGAFIAAWDRGFVFLRNAGTMILAVSMVLWWLSSYPMVEPPAEARTLSAQAEKLIIQADNDTENHDELVLRAEQVQKDADLIAAKYAARESFIGRFGSVAQPIFAPLGFDRQLTVGVLASFAAREVFVSTMAIVTTGSEDIDDQGVFQSLRSAKRDDGITPVFSIPVSWSLLVYYVLAMQCLPTLVVTAKEAGSIKWAGLQLAWMTGLAYVFALGAYHFAMAMGA